MALGRKRVERLMRAGGLTGITRRRPGGCTRRRADAEPSPDLVQRRLLGLSIADHLRTELVIDALQMALWRRGGHATGCVHHSDHGCQYTSWAFGTRLREAGLLASLGSVGDALDNSLAESFFATELLDRRAWTTRGELATAIFEYVECFYNPTRRHSTLDYLSPADYEHRHTAGPPGQAA